MGRELVDDIYNYALAAVAIGYVVLLVVLMSGGKEPGTTAPPAGSFEQPHAAGSRSPSSLALSVASSGAARLGLRPAPGSIRSSCTPEGQGSLCVVQGFTRLQGSDSCSINVFVTGVSGVAFVRDYKCQ